MRLARFAPGQCLITPGASKVLKLLAKQGVEGASPHKLLARHASGDWGELDAHDRAVNRRALRHGWRVTSAYRFPGPVTVRIWVITDGGTTTILLPEEY
jgi:hypothetical protein